MGKIERPPTTSVPPPANPPAPPATPTEPGAEGAADAAGKRGLSAPPLAAGMTEGNKIVEGGKENLQNIRAGQDATLAGQNAAGATTSANIVAGSTDPEQQPDLVGQGLGNVQNTVAADSETR